jgi:chromosome segregation protein
MLKLHRLEISGFKSFVDPTGLQFAGGVTAIVGPNGCGKSNISDSITWALGEQSAKSLRGDSMEDVIFNGSESRKPLGLADVTLTLLTDTGFAGAEDGTLTLSRRVFRTGESQYRLNGRVVRLKDFRDLLMDTGLGIRAYSVIEQGKIGMILSGKPQERRRLLEEAAGITRYKARKRVAEVKLEEATANLLRLHDIVAEVERNLRSLKRQAGNARRFQEKQSEVRELLRAVLDGRWSEQHRRLEALRLELEALVSEDAALAAALHGEEARLAAGRETLDALQQTLAERQRALADLGAAIEGRQEFLKGARQTLVQIEERASRGAALDERREQEAAEHAAALTGLAKRRAALDAEHDEARSAVAEDDLAIAAAEGAARDADVRLEASRSQLAAALGELTAQRNRLHREQLESEKGSAQQKHLGEQLSLWSTQIDESVVALESARARATELGMRGAEHAAHLEQTVAAQQEREARLAELGAKRRQLEDELAAARQRREFLADLRAAHAERRATLRAGLAAIGLDDPAFLGDRLAAPAGWERTLDLYLGELADAVLLTAGEDGLALAGQLSRSRTAGVLLRPIAGGAHAAPGDPAIVSTLAEALHIPPALAAALPPAYLVHSPADAARLAQDHPGVAFLSRDRVWAQGGALHVAGEQLQPGLLARESEAAALDSRLPAIESALGDLQQRLATLAAERDAAALDIAGWRAELEALRKEAAVAQARLDDASGRHRRLSIEHETLSTERQEVERELARVADRARAAQLDLERAEARHRELETAHAEAQRRAEDARSRRETLRTAGAGRRGRLDLLAERLQAHDAEAARLARQAEEARRQMAAWGEESADLGRRRGELEQAMARAEEELQAALERRAALEEESAGDLERVEGRRQDLRLLDEAIQARRAGRDELRGRIENLRVAQAGVRQDAEHVAAQFQEEFHQAPAAEPGAPPENLAELEGDLHRCREAVERLGPVNVLAAEEYREQEERHAFLTTQRADVQTSVESLRNTIREINQTSSERFKHTFAEVNASFARTFTDLFRGGEAEMRLLDEEDVLESGIEIVARPPGKRLQNIMLLSGGEKALTAIALLFALFRTKPSPFCILDEVDAPLDDVNTLRFVEMLREMSRETQFLVITHNKLTMEVASTLYGVTMEERGVSKLISVQLEDVQPEARAATA